MNTSGLNLYWYIPTVLEVTCANLVNAWLLESNSAFVCMIGVYNESNAVIMEPTTYTMVKDQNRNLIARTFTIPNDDGQLKKYSIKAFVLEGYLEPETESLALSLGVIKLEGAESARNYIQNN